MANLVDQLIAYSATSQMVSSLPSLSSLPLAFSKPEVEKKMKTDEEIIAFVRPILEEIKRTVISSHDIIPEWECPQLLPSLIPNYYTKHGEKLLDLINHAIEREENARFTDQASELLSATEKLQHPHTAEIIAISKFGRGECLETGQLLSLKCNLLGLETLSIGISNNPNARICSEADKNHLFILLGLDEESIEMITKKGVNVLTLLESLKRGVLVDPFLNVLCPLKKIATQGSDFLRYVKLINTLYINEVWEVNGELLKFAPQIEKDSVKIYLLAKKLQSCAQSILPLSPRNIPRYQAKKAVMHLLIADILLELKKITIKLNIPLPWKKNSEATNFWIKGSQEEIKRIQEQLQKFTISFSFGKVIRKSNEKSQYAIILENPQLSQLREINSSLTTSSTKGIDLLKSQS
jgi:hypothetical protein